MTKRAGDTRVPATGVEAAANGLLGLCAVMFVLHIVAPTHWTTLAVPVLALLAVGLRIEAAIRGRGPADG
ncbi:hypothetical protein ABZ249_00145 [Nocardiopsis sp. NPDC006139]|uniref:hypothetical protein n=1 Tax=unclassified Nocardiopsis TaxID=2649073 RepID=UPI0033A3685B